MKPSRARRGEWFARIGRLVAAGWLAAAPGGPARPTAGVAQVQAPAPAEEQGRRVADLTTRFRFVERYSPTEEPARPEAVVQARVAIRETIKIETENPRGAPERKQVVVQTIYTERPAELGSDGLSPSVVSAAVRRYDAFRLNPDSPGFKPSDPRPLEGLSVWYQPRLGDNPLVLSLSSGRGLRENEYAIISRQVFLPELSGVLPSLPSRIGDRWRITKPAARALLDERPQSGNPPTATLKDLHPEANGTDLEAIIAVTGQVTLSSGASAINAEVRFSFASPPDGAGDTYGGATLEARGAITDLRATQVTTSALPGSNGRLRQTQTRELILARQRDKTAALAIPDPKPTPTEANSWLTFVDPQKRFSFKHPQTLLPASLAGGESIELLRARPNGPDVIGVQNQPKTGNAEADRRNLDPEFHRKTLEEVWRQQREDVLRGPAGWLPEADWKSTGMKVFRIQAAPLLDAGPGGRVGPRVNFDYYLVLTGRSESFVVTARTLQDPPAEFRKETEAVIKTFRFGPPEAGR